MPRMVATLRLSETKKLETSDQVQFPRDRERAAIIMMEGRTHRSLTRLCTIVAVTIECNNIRLRLELELELVTVNITSMHATFPVFHLGSIRDT